MTLRVVMGISFPVVLGVLCSAAGLVFLFAAATKMKSPKVLKESLHDDLRLPIGVAGAVAALLIGLEAVIAVAHLGRIALPIVVPLTALMLAVLAVADSVRWMRGTGRRCLPFGGGGDDVLDGRSMARSGLLVGVESILFAGLFLEGVTPRAVGEFPDLIESMLVAGAGLVLVSWGLTIPEFRVWARLTRLQRRRRKDSGTRPQHHENGEGAVP